MITLNVIFSIGNPNAVNPVNLTPVIGELVAWSIHSTEEDNLQGTEMYLWLNEATCNNISHFSTTL